MDWFDLVTTAKGWEEPLETKEYLGDSVYAELVSGMIRLSTQNGEREPDGSYCMSNVIFLDSERIVNLSRFINQVFPSSMENKIK